MTQTPQDPEPPHGDPLTGDGPEAPQHPAPPPPSSGWQPGGQYGGQYGGQSGGGPAYGGPVNPANYNPYGQPGYTYDAMAPYGIHPATGLPYSDKSKLVAGLLQILLPLGIGRMYIGHTGTGVAQLLVTIFTCGVGAIWPFVDGFLILLRDEKDSQGRILRS